MSRGYSNYTEFESYDDGPLNTSYAGAGYADHVCRPVVVDAEGRKQPIVRYTPPNNSEGFVMRAESVVEHVTRAPVISVIMTDYKYGSSEKEDVFGEYGVEKRYTQLGSTYDRPEKVENFLTKIQNEASRPNKPKGPFNTNWRARPKATGEDGNGATEYGDDKDFIKGTNRKIYSIPIGDKQNGGYFQQGTNPGNTDKKYKFYERPNNAGPTVPSRPLSRPTNDINDVAKFLTDVNSSTKAPNLATNRWRKGLNFPAQGPKLDSGDDELEMFNEPKMNPRDNFEKYYPSGAANPINNSTGYGYEENRGQATSSSGKYQQPRFTVPPKEGNSSSETIDSSEAKKRYSKLKPQRLSEDAYSGAINSDELIKKYNGAKVPW